MGEKESLGASGTSWLIRICSESMVYLASIGPLLRRLAPSATNAVRYHVTSAAA